MHVLYLICKVEEYPLASDLPFRVLKIQCRTIRIQGASNLFTLSCSFCDLGAIIYREKEGTLILLQKSDATTNVHEPNVKGHNSSCYEKTNSHPLSCKQTASFIEQKSGQANRGQGRGLHLVWEDDRGFGLGGFLSSFFPLGLSFVFCSNFFLENLKLFFF